MWAERAPFVHSTRDVLSYIGVYIYSYKRPTDKDLRLWRLKT